MSYIVLKSEHARPSWLSVALDWLRQARVAATLANRDVEELSDHQLRDIGARRSDVAHALDRELGRIGLLDTGWQRPRRSHH
ncbi:MULTISPECIES: hypothetical protein [unclassified Mesorhizobium]|uniref:hypothetical protein n=1 Tax=unclassified Mesorhizobium TaxID=325217 RepID=UPI0009651D98|nr:MULTISPECIES: hypothetical protein [unclassified Mesorhizobium]MBN9257282.1 hypothetical protein [Mesorhizobium sp.]MBN9271432.1 hypothetical protein [Mesorhizobium sp.]OJX80600.1 MAG: hypothetical protein BGO93_00910 [Mesorhizobium sp. 65-26]